MHNKVIFANGTLDGNIHEMIDSSLVLSFAHAYKSVEVYSLNKRIEAINRLIKTERGEWNILYTGFKSFKRTSFYKDLWGAALDAYVYLFKGDKHSLYFYSYSNVFSRHVLNLLCKITHKDTIICVHSELEVAKRLPAESDNYWTKLMRSFYLNTKYSRHLRIMVLGDSILSNLKNYLGEDRLCHYMSIDHLYFNNRENSTHSFNNQDIHIGVVGAITKSQDRGFDNLVRFANSINKVKGINLHVISKIDHALLNTLPSNVVIDNPSGEYLSKEKYEYIINSMDYLYYPYPKDSFELTASGSIFESITNGKPALMYSNSYFVYLSKKYGDFGYFLDNLTTDRMLYFLRDESKYYQLTNNMVDITAQINPLGMSEELKLKCESICL